MILVFSPKRVSPTVSLEIVGDFNEEVVQPVPQYLLTPSPINSEYNKQNENETITSELKYVAQNPRIHPQESDSEEPQPPENRFLRTRGNIRNLNPVADGDEEEE
ncbi:hypothetical protein O181_009172 [Austropuccinia psidii MF-1]|uniref:Uncharacterized protein n=1 Tax=Austropuccinia psidii MF-1 TaxID=1389203 RepID=A0A9Q3BR72_9BASI|nr:hypothetical protein [Austropuccinia psidii MF-1]